MASHGNAGLLIQDDLKQEICKDENSEEKDVEPPIDPVVCTLCSKTFKSKYILNVHLKRHKFKGQFLCTLCGKGFNSQGCLNRHARVHTGKLLIYSYKVIKTQKRHIFCVKSVIGFTEMTN